jgi:hypothetical protein
MLFVYIYLLNRIHDNRVINWPSSLFRKLELLAVGAQFKESLTRPRAGQSKYLGSIPFRGKIFSLLRPIQTVCEVQIVSCVMGDKGFFSKVKTEVV